MRCLKGGKGYAAGEEREIIYHFTSYPSLYDIILLLGEAHGYETRLIDVSSI